MSLTERGHDVIVKFAIVQKVVDGLHFADVGLKICGLLLHGWRGRGVRQ
jgi:hypothetical protein